MLHSPVASDARASLHPFRNPVRRRNGRLNLNESTEENDHERHHGPSRPGLRREP
jgi:hypothetical protein